MPWYDENANDLAIKIAAEIKTNGDAEDSKKRQAHIHETLVRIQSQTSSLNKQVRIVEGLLAICAFCLVSLTVGLSQ